MHICITQSYSFYQVWHRHHLLQEASLISQLKALLETALKELYSSLIFLSSLLKFVFYSLTYLSKS